MMSIYLCMLKNSMEDPVPTIEKDNFILRFKDHDSHIILKTSRSMCSRTS